MDTNTTRRSLLRLGTGAIAYGAGAAVVAGGVALAGEAKSATLSPGRRAWDRTMTAYTKAAATFAVTDQLHDKVYAAWKADAPSTDTIDLGEFWPMTAAQVARMDPDKQGSPPLSCRRRKRQGLLPADSGQRTAPRHRRDRRAPRRRLQRHVRLGSRTYGDASAGHRSRRVEAGPHFHARRRRIHRFLRSKVRAASVG
jgi:hypothetical protein